MYLQQTSLILAQCYPGVEADCSDLLYSPIASLSYVLWNIKVTAKCALISDMAVKLNDYPGEDSEFAQMRDSLYILAVMNQCQCHLSLGPSRSHCSRVLADSIKRRMPAQEGEKLLRIALFSNALPIKSKRGSSAVERRQSLASTLRATRKKGVVPVYISLAWFIFSLALSIEDAFGKMGDNQTAHNLALGLLLAWLPCFLTATTVDRNPVGADRIRRKLNKFLEDTRVALLDSGARKSLLLNSERKEVDLAFTSVLDIDDFYRDGFFTRFAGQGRTRWHYGVAHPILAAMEGNHVAASGRGWLADTKAARAAIVWGPVKHQGLMWFDPRMAWQISSSLIVVGSTVFGAFILSCKLQAPFARGLISEYPAITDRLSRLHSYGRPGVQKRRIHDLLYSRAKQLYLRGAPLVVDPGGDQHTAMASATWSKDSTPSPYIPFRATIKSCRQQQVGMANNSEIPLAPGTAMVGASNIKRPN